MNRASNFYIKQIAGLERVKASRIQSFFKKGFNDSEGYGFIETEFNEEFIKSILIYQVKIQKTAFNPSLENFEVHEETDYYRIKFSIRFHDFSLRAYAGGRRLVKLISILNRISSSGLEVRDTYLNLASLLIYLRKAGIACKVIGLRIENFRPNRGVSGQFIANLEDSRFAEELLVSYGHNVTEVKILHEEDEESAVWIFSSSGKVCVKADEELLEQQEEKIQNIVMEICNA